MPIDKFGLFERRNDATGSSRQLWSGLLRNYVRENALCRVATDFDARSRKICRVALPVDDNDAANKLYVEQYVKTLTNRQGEFNEKLVDLENRVQALWLVISELQGATTAVNEIPLK